MVTITGKIIGPRWRVNGTTPSNHDDCPQVCVRALTSGQIANPPPPRLGRPMSRFEDGDVAAELRRLELSRTQFPARNPFTHLGSYERKRIRLLTSAATRKTRD